MINHVIAAALLLSPAQPQAASPRPCLTSQQVDDLAVAMLPYIIDAARGRCGAHLGPGAFLTGPGGAEMAAQLRSEADSRRTAVAAAFRIFGNGEMPPGVSDATLIQVMGEGITGEFVGSIGANSCRNLDQILEAMSPLPPARVGRLVAAFFALALSSTSEHRDVDICPA